MTLASPFMAVLRDGEDGQVNGSRRAMTKRESCSSRGGDRRRSAGDQAAREMPAPSIGTGKALRRSGAWASRMSAAVSRQVPQVAPQPVRMVSSATLRTPLAAASRIWWSVTPLQMQTYKRWIPGGPVGWPIPSRMRMIVNSCPGCRYRVWLAAGKQGAARPARVSRHRAASAAPPGPLPPAGRKEPDGAGRGHRPRA